MARNQSISLAKLSVWITGSVLVGFRLAIAVPALLLLLGVRPQAVSPGFKLF